jgi:hypothetical protein
MHVHAHFQGCEWTTAGMWKKTTWLQQIAATLPPNTGPFRPNTHPGGACFLLASSNVSRFTFFLVPCPPQKFHGEVKSSFMLAPQGLTAVYFARATTFMY